MAHRGDGPGPVRAPGLVDERGSGHAGRGLAAARPAARDAGPAAASSEALIELLFFAYRDFVADADRVLEAYGFGRAHHRVLHFVGRNPGIAVSDLLAILRITKQSLARVLNELVEQDHIALAPGHADRRQRLLTLTPSGQALERRLYERQRERLASAYRDAGGAAVEGFRRVMRGIMDDNARSYVDRAEPGPSRARQA